MSAISALDKDHRGRDLLQLFTRKRRCHHYRKPIWLKQMRESMLLGDLPDTCHSGPDFI